MSIYLLFIININMFVKFWRREKNPKLTFSGCCCAIVRSTAKRIGGEICGGLSVYALSFSCVVVAGLPDRNQQLVDIGAMDVDEQRARGACKILSLEARSSEADRVN